jgi:CRISPR/Cas system-associated exonuclease Cas4 (RecB family)
MERPALTPTQQRVLEQIRLEPTPLVFDEEFVEELIEHVTGELAEFSARLGGEKLFVSKSFLTRVHGCEAHHLAPSDFAWTPATAKGFVAHKAIELGVHWQGEPAPAQLVDEALARLADSGGNRGDWIAALAEADRAELRGFAVERVTRFMQDFPPLPASGHPITEATTRFEPGGSVQLSGKADLVLGRPDGRISKRLIVDFKTGWRSHHHRDDLRFYALLETLTRRVPPRKLVTFYLDEGVADVEAVTDDVLTTAMERMLDAIDLHVQLAAEGREPVKRPGRTCRWCPLLPDCDEGRSHLAALADDGSQSGVDETE